MSLDSDARNNSTGSLSLVRTVLNYQNVTNDPTCRVPLSVDAKEAILLTSEDRAKRTKLVLAYMGSLVRRCCGLHTHTATFV